MGSRMLIPSDCLVLIQVPIILQNQVVSRVVPSKANVSLTPMTARMIEITTVIEFGSKAIKFLGSVK